MLADDTEQTYCGMEDRGPSEDSTHLHKLLESPHHYPYTVFSLTSYSLYKQLILFYNYSLYECRKVSILLSFCQFLCNIKPFYCCTYLLKKSMIVLTQSQ